MTGTRGHGTDERRGMQMYDRTQPRDVRQLDDFEVIAERQRVTAALAALTEYYQQLNDEISGRKPVQWMLTTRSTRS